MGLWDTVKDVGKVAFPVTYLASGGALDVGKQGATALGITGGGAPPGPRQTYYGGTPEKRDEYAAQAQAGVDSGRSLTGKGLGQLQGGVYRAQDIADSGRAMMGLGAHDTAQGTTALGNVAQGAGRWKDDYGHAQLAQARARDTAMQAGIAYGQQYQQDRAAQTASLNQLGRAAAGQAPSQAEAMMQANAAANQRAQMAQAAGMRGGNALAGMRSAQATGAQTAMATGDQAAALRAQEMATARGQFAAQANAMAGASQGGQQWGVNQGGAMAMGMGAQAQGLAGLQANAGASLGALGNQQTAMGLGAQQFGANAQIGAGQFTAGLGAQREQEYLAWLNGMNTAQIGADSGVALNAANLAQQRYEGNQRFTGGLIGTAGNVGVAML